MGLYENLIHMARRKDHPLLQFIKYGICGGLATATDLVIFYLGAIYFLPALTPDDVVVKLLGLNVSEVSDDVRGFRYVVDSGISFLFANMVAYVTNVIFVFEAGRHSRVKELLLFYLVSGVSVFLGVWLGSALINYLGWTTTMAKLANVVTAVLINYGLRRYYIFKG